MIRPPLPALVITTAALLLVVLVSACTKTGPAPATGAGDAALTETDRLAFAQIEQDHQLHRDREVLAAGERQLARTDPHPWADRIALDGPRSVRPLPPSCGGPTSASRRCRRGT